MGGCSLLLALETQLISTRVQARGMPEIVSKAWTGLLAVCRSDQIVDKILDALIIRFLRFSQNQIPKQREADLEGRFA